MRDTYNATLGILIGALAGGLVWVVAVGALLITWGWI